VPPQTPEDARWFAEEVQPHERSLRAYLKAAAPATADPDDLLQETYLRLLHARENGVPIRCAKALLYAIARNAVRDAVRQKLTNREIPGTEIDALPVLDNADVVDLVSRRQEQVLLAEAIGALPTRCREVLLLRKIHGLSQKEIAAQLGISENTVESLVARGVRRCADHLRKRLDRAPRP
jgi:RNA polymerase sigma-70 factor (ECF subfamily)